MCNKYSLKTTLMFAFCLVIAVFLLLAAKPSDQIRLIEISEIREMALKNGTTKGYISTRPHGRSKATFFTVESRTYKLYQHYLNKDIYENPKKYELYGIFDSNTLTAIETGGGEIIYIAPSPLSNNFRKFNK